MIILTIVSLIIGLIVGFTAGIIIINKILGKSYGKMEKDLQRERKIMYLLNIWLSMAQEKKSMATYIGERGYKEIAIYGMGILGQRLCDELSDSQIIVKYAIDKRADSIIDMVNVVKPTDKLKEVDAIIVTPLLYFSEIKKDLEGRINCPICSIEDFICPERRIVV